VLQTFCYVAWYNLPWELAQGWAWYHVGNCNVLVCVPQTVATWLDSAGQHWTPILRCKYLVICQENISSIYNYSLIHQGITFKKTSFMKLTISFQSNFPHGVCLPVLMVLILNNIPCQKFYMNNEHSGLLNFIQIKYCNIYFLKTALTHI
jgi:hypothetical protein